MLKDLTDQVRSFGKRRRPSNFDRIEEAERVTALIQAHKQHDIGPEQFKLYRDILLGKRPKSNAAVPPDEVGPNGHRISYTEDGDKIEWVPSEEGGEDWPMILRRGDDAILKMREEFWEKVWYGRSKASRNALPEEIEARRDENQKAIEEKYGAENLRWDDFEWGALYGKMVSLGWVLGLDWDVAGDT